MNTITLSWLREQRACKEQVAVFEREWGTEERLRALGSPALPLDLEWLASRLLTAPALAEYERVTDYARVTAPAWATLRARHGCGADRRAVGGRGGAVVIVLIALLSTPAGIVLLVTLLGAALYMALETIRG